MSATWNEIERGKKIIDETSLETAYTTAKSRGAKVSKGKCVLNENHESEVVTYKQTKNFPLECFLDYNSHRCFDCNVVFYDSFAFYFVSPDKCSESYHKEYKLPQKKNKKPVTFGGLID